MILRALTFLATAATLFAATAPFSEDFEAGTGAPGADHAAASADWSSDSAGTALISNNGTVITELGTHGGPYPLPAAAHAQVLEVGSNTQLALSQANNETTTSDMMVRAVRATTAPAGSAADQCAVYIDDATGQLAIWHDDTIGLGGNKWTILAASPVIADKTWIRLTVTKDYRNKRFKVAVNGSEISDALGYPANTGAGANGPWFSFVNQNDSLATLEVEGSSADPTYIEDVVINSELIITADEYTGSSDAGDGTPDTFAFTQSGGNINLSINGQPFVNNPITSPEISVSGTDDDDTVTFDLGGGTLPTFNFDAGNGTDSLTLSNAHGNTLTYTPVNLTDGTLDIDGNVITFTGLDPIVQSGSLDNVIITDNTVGNHSMAFTSVGGGTQTQVTGDFETLTFANPRTSLTLNSGVGDDAVSITQSALNALGGRTITFNGEAHGTGDTLTVDAENGWAIDNTGTVTGHAWTLTYNTFEAAPTLNNVNLAAVPALGTWGVVILALLVAIGGVRNMPNSEVIQVCQQTARETAAFSVTLVIGLYLAALALGSTVTIWDLPGLLITCGLLNYLSAWFKQYTICTQAQVCRETR